MDLESLYQSLCTEPATALPLPVCAILAEGEDAEGFLQGQFTVDLTRLQDGDSRVTAWCTAKGRVWSLLRVQRQKEGFVLFLPEELSEAFLRRIRMFVLRAKVNFCVMESRVHGLMGAEPQDVDVKLDDYRGLCLQAPTTPLSQDPCDAARWKALGLLRGEVFFTAEMQEKYLPQALGLVALDGLHFNKGCYVGQEIVARVHYRGKAPQRLNTIINPSAAQLDGHILLDEAQINGQRIAQVIEYLRDA